MGPKRKSKEKKATWARKEEQPREQRSQNQRLQRQDSSSSSISLANENENATTTHRKRMMTKRSKVYSCYRYNQETKEYECIYCKPEDPFKMHEDIVSLPSRLAYHLKAVHPQQSPFPIKRGFSNTQPQIADYTLQLICDGGLSFSFFKKCPFFRRAFFQLQERFPNCPQNHISKQYRYYHQKVKQFIQSKLDEEEKFSLSFDEGTLINNRKYLVVNIHCKDGTALVLGFLRVKVQATAQQLINIITQCLAQFNISLKTHIVAFVCDGAAVNSRISKDLQIPMVFCGAHTIHLAVNKAIYEQDIQVPFYPQTCEDSEQQSQQSQYDSEEQYEQALQEDEIFFNSIQGIIKNVKKLVLYFKKSPKNTDQLLKLQELQIMRRLATNPLAQKPLKKFKLYHSTRWKSLYGMLKRFIELYPFAETLVPIELQFSKSALEEIKQLINILEAVERCTNFVLKSTTNAYDTVKALYKLVDHFEFSSHPFAQRLSFTLRRYISIRHQGPINQLVQFLESPRNSRTFNKENLQMIRSLFVNMNIRLFRKQKSENQPEASRSRIIEFEVNPSQTDIVNDELKNLNERFLMKKFDSIEKLEVVNGLALTLKKAFRSVPGTSIFCERILSVASTVFLTKGRASLEDKMLHSLIF